MSRRGRRGAGWRVAGLALAALLGVGAWLASSGRLASLAAAPAGPPPVSAPPAQGSGAIAALGRLEPKDGVRRIAGPAQMVAVVGRAARGQARPRAARAGDRPPRRDGAPRGGAGPRRGAASRTRRPSSTRHLELHKGDVISDSKRDELQLALDVARADLTHAEAELERARVRSPIDGQVLEVHARDGERVERRGHRRARAHPGDVRHRRGLRDRHRARAPRPARATVRAPRCRGPLRGAVDRIGLKVGKQDALGTDPAARTDARVVEVEIRLSTTRERARRGAHQPAGRGRDRALRSVGSRSPSAGSS